MSGPPKDYLMSQARMSATKMQLLLTQSYTRKEYARTRCGGLALYFIGH